LSRGYHTIWDNLISEIPLALKKNHSTLYDDVTLLLDEARAKAFAEIDHAYHEQWMAIMDA
jgi:hypothetical protein